MVAEAKTVEIAPKEDQIPVYHTQRVQVPEQIIPDKRFITILDTGPESAIVGMALAGLINYLTGVRDGSPFRASPRMLYEMAKKYDGIGDKYSSVRGTFLWAALYGWQKHGVTTEDMWPYIPDKQDDQLTEEREQAASPFKPQSYERVPKDIQVIKAAILERGGVFAGATVNEGWYQPKDGVIPYNPDAQTIGGIAINLLGYTPKGFIIQNAWGESWGNLVLDGQSYPGMALWTYPDFEANLQDAYVVRLWPASGAAQAKPFNNRAGYLSDSPFGGQDYLNIMPDVRSIAAVLAARDVEPPLALGLFGNWGTGKTFFMECLKKEIERLSNLESDNPGETPYCTPIVQIQFNAWHFLDTNLWASLVSEIFDRLHDRIRPPGTPLEETRSKLVKELGDAEGLYRQSQLELQEAQQDLNIAETSLVISQIARAVGAEKFASTNQELFAQVRQLVSFRARLRQLGIMLLKEKGRVQRLGLLALFTVGAAAVGWLANLLAGAYPGVFSQLGSWINASWTWALGILGWLAAQWRTVSRFISKLEEKSSLAYQLTDNQKKYLAGLLEGEKEKQGDVNASVELAEQKVKDAKERLEQVKRELTALSPRWQMQQYIIERSSSQDYRSQLGLISLIRKDFERMSDLLEKSEQENSPGEGFEQAGLEKVKLPFERIILYIDDLDRCTPKRVVEVLEAVHLLLAFRLFVVVVAVDPRWLRTCLEWNYPELLSMQAVQGEDPLDQPATPQDYLEKIFQIPFYLRPIDTYGYRNMIRNLVSPLVYQESKPGAGLGGAPLGSVGGDSAESQPGDGDHSISRQKTVEEGDDKTPETGGNGLEEGASKEAEPESINPDLLKFQSWEMDDMARLSPLFRTPRAVKRFINTYRLVKVGVKPEEILEFEGTRQAPGTYRIAQALLGIVAGYPNQAQRFLERLLAQVDAEKTTATWSKFLEDCKAHPGLRPEEKPATASKRTAKAPAASATQPPDLEEQEWLQLCEALAGISAEGFLEGDLGPYIEMVKPVARFSFSVSDLPELRKK